jgi:hypothetical protein
LEREVAELKAAIVELIQAREAAETADPTQPTGDAEAYKVAADLRAKLADVAQAKAEAESASHAQEVEKDRLVAQLRVIEQGGDRRQAADKDRLQADLNSAEATLKQKMAEVRKLEAQIQALSQKLKSAQDAAQRGGGESRRQPIGARVVQDREVEEIILRKVDGKWEIVIPRAARSLGAGKAGWQVAPAPERPRIVVTPDVPRAARPVIAKPIELKTPSRSAPADRDSRLDQLEKKVDKILQQLEQMRREMTPGRRGAVLPLEGGPDDVVLPLRVIVDAPAER